MTQPRFLADHDLNEHIIAGVLRREPAIEFIRSREIGLADRPDSEVLEFAAAQRLIVVSHDVNTMPAAAFARLQENTVFAGLLMVAQSEPVGPIIDELLLIWAATEAEEWQNQIRFLPLR